MSTAEGGSETIGYAALQVIPTMRGVEGMLDGQLAGPMAASGRAAGLAAGQAIATGLDQAKAAVEAASERLAQAREKEADAAGKVRIAEEKLRELRESGRATASQLARAEEALSTAQRAEDRAGRARQAAVQNLTDARERLANATDEATESQSRFGAMMDSLNSKLGPAEAKMMAAAAATAGLGAAMAAASEIVSREKTTDALAASLGATPALAAEYGAAASSLYAQGFGESFGEVTEAIGVVQSGFHTLGSEGEASMEAVTGKALNFAAVFGTEVAENVQVASQLVTNGLAKDSTEAFDMMTTAFQRVPVAMRDELPAILNEYGTHFRGLGFSGEQAFSLLVDYAQQGAWALDKSGDALKEFTLLGSDMSASSQEAYKAIGLDAAEMSRAVATGGAEAQNALHLVASGLLEIEDPAERANTAIALFGTPVEDLAIDQIPQFLQALTGGSNSMAGFAGAADQMGQTLSDNAATKLEIFKRGVQEGLIGALTSSVEWVDRNREVAAGLAIALGVVVGALVTAKVAAAGYAVTQGIAAAATGAGSAALAGNSLALGAYAIASGVVRGATLAWSAVQWVLNAALSANPIGLVVVAIGALIAGIVLAYKNSETFRDIVQACWEGIKVAALWTWDNVLKPVFDWIVGGYTLAWNAAKAAGEGIGAAWQWISDKATAAKDWVVNAFNTVVDFVTGLPERVRSAASGLWDGITDGFKRAINWLIEKWNSFSLGFDFNIPVINQKVNFRIDTPDLPLLAGGGIAGRSAAGLLRGPGTGTSDSILGLDALTGLPTAFVSTGEGVVNVDAMRRGGAALVAALNDGWVPPLALLQAMLPGLAGGGIASGAGAMSDTQQAMWEALRSAWPDATVTSATRTVDVGSGYDFHMQGKAIDIGGPDMLGIAAWIAKQYPGSLELIHGNGFSHNIDEGRDVGNGMSFFGSDTMAGHNDHVHWAMNSAPAMPSIEPGSGAGSMPSLGGGSPSGGGNGSGASGGNGSGTAGSGTRPDGPAQLVWVDNMPTNFGGASSTPVGGSGVEDVYNPSPPDAGAAANTGGAAAEVEHPMKNAPGLLGELASGPAPWWMAATPEAAAANLGKQAGDLAAKTATGAQDFMSSNWREMLQTAAAVVGMGASGGGGGDTYNLIGPDPKASAAAVERVQRRRTIAMQRGGGFGR